MSAMRPWLLTLVGLAACAIVGCYRTHQRVDRSDSSVDAFSPDASGPDAAVPGQDLFPTGVDGDLRPLGDDADDPHWTIQIEGMSARPARTLPPTNFCSSCGGIFLHHPQPNRVEDSRPIFAPPPTLSDADGVRVRYATTFAIPTGASLGSADAITFLVGYDNFTLDAEGRDAPANTAIAFVNGTEIRRTCRDGFPGSFDTTCSFAIPGTALRIGPNTLEFRVRNESGPYGFRLRSVVTRY